MNQEEQNKHTQFEIERQKRSWSNTQDRTNWIMTSDHSIQIPHYNGKLMFQFDDDDPIEISNINTGTNRIIFDLESNSKIEFQSEAKRFKLFIQPVINND